MCFFFSALKLNEMILAPYILVHCFVSHHFSVEICFLIFFCRKKCMGNRMFSSVCLQPLVGLMLQLFFLVEVTLQQLCLKVLHFIYFILFLYFILPPEMVVVKFYTLVYYTLSGGGMKKRRGKRDDRDKEKGKYGETVIGMIIW